MDQNEKSEVEKLARLVRQILLFFIWVAIIGAALGFFGGFMQGYQGLR
ncbi:MAG: hypothetical protein JNN02_06265 [Tabrizicola sp.]|nr:hypothetical protein [Tabrizicola sp.]